MSQLQLEKGDDSHTLAHCKGQKTHRGTVCPTGEPQHVAGGASEKLTPPFNVPALRPPTQTVPRPTGEKCIRVYTLLSEQDLARINLKLRQ